MGVRNVHNRLLCDDVSDFKSARVQAATSFCVDDGKHECVAFKLNASRFIGCRSCVFMPSDRAVSDEDALMVLQEHAKLTVGVFDFNEPKRATVTNTTNLTNLDSANVAPAAHVPMTSSPVRPRNLASACFDNTSARVVSNRMPEPQSDDDDDEDDDVVASPPAPRYNVHAPAVHEFSDEEHVEVPMDAAWAALPDDQIRARAMAATKQPVTMKTMKKYKAWCKQHWKPFARQHGYDVADVTPQIICYWIEWMTQKGTCSRGTIVNYINAFAWQWRQHPCNAGKADIFQDDAVLNVRKGLNKRINVSVPLDVRYPVTPRDMMAIKDGVENSLERFDSMYERYETHGAFAVEELRALRAGVACLIGYTFGLRAQQLYFLEASFFRFEFGQNANEYTFGLAMRDGAPGDKTHSNGAARSGLDRVMSASPWSAALRRIFLRFHECVRVFYSVRLIDEGNSTLGEDTLEPSKNQASYFETLSFEQKQEYWWAKKATLALQELPKRYLYLPFLNAVGQRGTSELERCSEGNEHQTVSSWLSLALRTNDCPKAPRGTKYSSHSLRSGGASAFHCVQPASDLNRLRWWFHWNVHSDIAQDHYIDHQWKRRDHPDAEYFWGAIARHD